MMKQFIYTMVLGLMLSACTNSEQNTMVISVLEDTTEADFLVKPDASVLYTKFNMDTNLWQSATFRYGTINSLIHNIRNEVSIPQEKELLGNELERKRLVKAFKQKVFHTFESSKDSSIYKHSSIWLPIVEEITLLQQQPNWNTELYIFSDLQENSRFFSVFNMADLHLLHQKQDQVVELFLSKSKAIQATDSIKVIVVFQPQTIDEDELFQKLKQLYLTLFSKLGIAIEFKANLN